MSFLKTTKRKITLAVVIAVLIVGIVLAVVFLGGNKEAYRIISISELVGDVTAENNGNSYAAYANMNLSDGYALSTGVESYTRMVLDSDKYVKLEEESRAVFEKLGKKGDGNTTINLEKGAITNEITKPLAEGETYIINTPNSVLAVRGTFFRVQVNVDEKGECYTDILTYGGSVECKRVLPDGEIVDESVIIDAGYKTSIKMDTADTVFVIDEVSVEGETVNVVPINIEEDIPDDDIVDILDASQNGHEMFIENEEIIAVIEEREIEVENYTSRYSGAEMSLAGPANPPAYTGTTTSYTSAPTTAGLSDTTTAPVDIGTSTFESVPTEASVVETEASVSDEAAITASSEEETPVAEEIEQTEVTEEIEEAEVTEETEEAEVSEETEEPEEAEVTDETEETEVTDETEATEETEDTEETTPAVTTVPVHTGSPVTSAVIHECSFENYIYNNDATCTTDGTETATCVCGKTDTITAEGTATGHTFESYLSDNNATCTEDGTKTAKCENCDETDTTDDIGSAKGHDTETEIISNPTFYTEGSSREYCTVEGCDYEETSVIDILEPLDLSDGDVIITATGYSQDGGAEIAFTDKYLFSGTSTDKSLTVQSGTHNIEFSNTSLTVTDMAAIIVENGAAATLSGTLTVANTVTDAVSENNYLNYVSLLNNGTVEFNTGTFKFTGNNYAVSNNGSITVTDGTVEAAATIGFQNSGGTITVSGGTLKATDVDYGIYNQGGTVTLSSGTCNLVTAGYSIYNNDTLNIKNGTLDCTGGYISNSEDGNVTISGGSITAGSFYTYSNVVMTNGSLLIGDTYTGGSGSIVNNSGETLYRLEISNPNNSEVKIDGTAYSPSFHSSTDTMLYAYVTGGYHTVTAGGTDYYYNFNSATNEFETADLQITGTNLEYGTDFTYPADTGVLTINTSKAVTIAGTTTTDTVFITNGVNANVTLAGVNIDVSGTDNACAFEIENDTTGDVTITLAEGTENTLKSGSSYPGLRKSGNGNNAASLGMLTITGTGSLTAVGGSYGAGIGGADDGVEGVGLNITIESGNITATGGSAGAGIGGAYGAQGKYITINGGTVVATGGSGGAGIGGGMNHIGEYITITGGSVTAISTSGYGIGSASGCGYAGSYTDSFVISGGSVKITADYYGAEIGNGTSAITPNNGTDSVYLLTIANYNREAVMIDGAAYPLSCHSGEDVNLYIYLTGTDHTVTIGSVTYAYTFDSAAGTFTLSA